MTTRRHVSVSARFMRFKQIRMHAFALGEYQNEDRWMAVFVQVGGVQYFRYTPSLPFDS